MRTLRAVLAFAVLGMAARSPGASPAGPKTFSTPRHAAEALVAAVGDQDVVALVAIFGADGSALVVSGDDVRDRNDRVKFTELARERLDLAVDPKWKAVSEGDTMLVHVVMPKVEEEPVAATADAAAATTAVPAEPEVIKKGKTDDKDETKDKK